MNNISLVGNLTKDSELKYTQNGTAVLSFPMAIARGFKQEDGTDFVNIVVYGTLAEKLAEFYVKGLRVSVVGRLRIDNHKDENGFKTFVKVIATETRALSNKKSNSDDFGSDPVDDGDMPF